MGSTSISDSKVKITGIPITTETFSTLVEKVESLANGWILSINLEFFYYLRRNPWLRQLAEKSAFNLPDGVMVSLVINRKMKKPVHRIPGIDLAAELLKRGKRKFFFLGAREETVRTAVLKLRHQYPATEICGWHSGYFQDSRKVLAQIRRSGADFLLLGMGMPGQERFIYQNFFANPSITIMTVGGGIEVFAGKVKRAPIWMQKKGLEWLYRTAVQPSRFPRLLRSAIILPTLFWSSRKEQ